MINRIKIFTACLVYSVTVVFTMSLLISYFLYNGGLTVDCFTFAYNVALLFCITMFVVCLLGKGLGIMVIGLFTVFILGGYSIKLIYHNSFLKPGDLMLFSEFATIGIRFVKPWHILLLAAAVILGLWLLYKFKKQVLKSLIPHPNIGAALFFGIILAANTVYITYFNDRTEPDDKSKFAAEGFTVFTYYNLKDFTKLYPDTPEDYTPEKMAEISSEIEGFKAADDNIKPDVIMVMFESYCDIGGFNEIGLTKDVTKTGRKYQTANMISPRYGGGTATTEFEALTGFSSLFFMESVVPYDAYMTHGDRQVPSIVSEFNKSGYRTTAIHPSTADCYHRDAAYSELGFDKFYTIDDFDIDKNRDMTNDNMTKDFKVREKIEDQLALSGDGVPQFIFAVTFQAHCPYENKFDKSDIEFDVNNPSLSEKQKEEVLQYSRCVYDSSQVVEELAEYVENRSRPTILICFGDHLPPLSAFKTTGILDDPYKKYSTPIMEYCNYKPVLPFESDYVSPVYISDHILDMAGISHSSYFDYIGSLSKAYPVLNREFDPETESAELKKYNLIQYDLFFGSKYLINNSQPPA